MVSTVTDILGFGVDSDEYAGSSLQQPLPEDLAAQKILRFGEGYDGRDRLRGRDPTGGPQRQARHVCCGGALTRTRRWLEDPFRRLPATLAYSFRACDQDGAAGQLQRKRGQVIAVVTTALRVPDVAQVSALSKVL